MAPQALRVSSANQWLGLNQQSTSDDGGRIWDGQGWIRRNRGIIGCFGCFGSVIFTELCGVWEKRRDWRHRWHCEWVKLFWLLLLSVVVVAAMVLNGSLEKRPRLHVGSHEVSRSSVKLSLSSDWNTIVGLCFKSACCGYLTRVVGRLWKQHAMALKRICQTEKQTETNWGQPQNRERLTGQGKERFWT